MLLAIAWFNGLTVLGLILVLCIRWNAEERSFEEARRVTYMLVGIEALLKVVDVVLPLALTFSCFPGSIFPPYDSDQGFFANYGLYCLVKVGVGGVDVVVNTGTMAQKPGDWYRMKRIG